MPHILTYETPLAGDATWVCETTDAATYSSLSVVMTSDAPCTYYVQFSVDGVTWGDSTLSWIYTPGETFVPHVLQIARKYFRVGITNGSTPQTYVRLQLIADHRGALTSPLNSIIEAQADATIVRAISEEIPIAAGRFRGITIVNKFGINRDVDGPEDVWNVGGTYTGFPDDAETVQVFSSDAADTIDGTGARTVQLYGLDASGAEITETVNMSGVTPAVTTLEFWRLNRAVVRSAGTGGANAGTITIRQSATTANVFGSVYPGSNQSEIAAYTIPAGKTGYIREINVSVNRASTAGQADREAECSLFIRPPGEVFQTKAPMAVSNGSPFIRILYGGIQCRELSDLKIRVRSVSRTDTVVAAGFDLVLIDDL